MAQLVVKYGVKNEGTTNIDQTPYVIGRGPTAALRLDNPLVSREHCAIHHGGGQFVIQDLKSSSGTMVNGRGLTAPHMLSDGDKIEIGMHSIIFELGFADAGVSSGGGSDASASACCKLNTLFQWPNNADPKFRLCRWVTIYLVD